MVKTVKEFDFSHISPNYLLEASAKAAENFQVRAFFEAKDEIVRLGKFSEMEFYEILDALIDAETERKILLEELSGQEPLFLEEIIKIIKKFPPENVIRDIIYLKEQGYIEEFIEIKTKKVKKKIKGEVKEVEEPSADLAQKFMEKCKRAEKRLRFDKAIEFAVEAKNIFSKLGAEWNKEVNTIEKYVDTLKRKKEERLKAFDLRKEEIEKKEVAIKKEEDEFKSRITARREARRKRIEELMEKK